LWSFRAWKVEQASACLVLIFAALSEVKRKQAEQAAEKGPHSFCHSERSEESLFLFMGLNRREIPRFARNDKINYLFRSLFSLSSSRILKFKKKTG
jgi:hypothetical protein